MSKNAPFLNKYRNYTPTFPNPPSHTAYGIIRVCLKTLRGVSDALAARDGYEYEKWDKSESPPFPWNDRLKWVQDEFPLDKNAWPGELTEFIRKHTGRDHGLLGLLQAGHAMASGIEKNMPKDTSQYLGQDTTHMWMSSAFGTPVRNLLADPPEALTEAGWKRLLEQIKTLLINLEVLANLPEAGWKHLISQIKKLLDTHIQANEVVQLNEPVNIFDDKMFDRVKEEQGVGPTKKTTASRADMIVHATKKVIAERMDEDPALYEKFSKLIQQAIEDFRTKRISDLDYLSKAVEIRNKVVGKVHEDIPEALSGNEDAAAYFGVLKPFLEKHELGEEDLESAAANAAMTIDGILEKHGKVGFWDDEDAQKQAVNEIDDYLYDEIRTGRGIALSLEQMDGIIEKVLRVAKHRSYKS